MASHVTKCTWRKLPVGELTDVLSLVFSPGFLSKKILKTDKETKFKHPNTSKINA